MALVQHKSGNAKTVTLDAAPTQGNLLVCIGGSRAAGNYTAPSGWSEAKNDAGTSGNPGIAVWFKIAGSSESSTVTYTADTSSSMYIAVLEFSGASGSVRGTPLSATGNSDSPRSGSMTSNSGDILLSTVFSKGSVNTFTSWISSFVEEESVQTGSGGGSSRCATAFVNSTGSVDSGCTTVSEIWRCTQVAFAPAGVDVSQTATADWASGVALDQARLADFESLFGVKSWRATFTSRHSFSGDAPLSGVIYVAGNFYGSFPSGAGGGVVYKMAPDGTYTALKTFASGDGKPSGRLVYNANDDLLYGTTENGGTNTVGSVWKMHPDGTGYAVVASFSTGGTGGSLIRAGLCLASDGKLYGTTQLGGTNNVGCLFRVSTSGTIEQLGSFSTAIGKPSPRSHQLIQAVDGTIWGVAETGGTSDWGTIWKYTSGGGLAVVWTFANGADGWQPTGALIQGSDGYLYGTTAAGGPGDRGIVFKFDPAGPTLTQIGTFPVGDSDFGVVQGSDGDLYGSVGVGLGNAIMYRVKTTGGLEKLAGIGTEDVVGLVEISPGIFYGTASQNVFSFVLSPVVDYEALAGIAQPRIADWESMAAAAAVSHAAIADFEARTTAAASAIADWASGLGLRPTRLSDYEGLGGVAAYGGRQAVPVSVGFIHGLIYEPMSQRLFGCTFDYPPQLVRFNDLNDLSDHDIITLSTTTPAGTQALDLIWGNPDPVFGLGKIYVAVVATHVIVHEIDPDTLSDTVVINDDLSGVSPWFAGNPNAQSLTTDSTSLFIACGGNATTLLVQYALSDWSRTAIAGDSFRGGHCIRHDDNTGYLYMTGWHPTDNGRVPWIARYVPDPLSREDIQSVGSNTSPVCDDIEFFGNYVWCPLEQSDGSNLVKVQKDSLATQVILSPGIKYLAEGICTDGTYLWVSLFGSPGVILRVDPTTHAMTAYPLLAGENKPDEIRSGGVGRLFIAPTYPSTQMVRVNTPWTFGFPVGLESIVTPAVTRVADWESLASSGVAVNKSAIADWEALFGAVQTRAGDFESGVSMSRSRSADWGSGLGLAVAKVADIESALGLSPVRVADFEAGAGIAATRSVGYEALVAFTQSRLATLESLAGQARATVTDLESLRQISGSASADWESQGQVAVIRSITADLEAVAGLAAARVADLESVVGLTKSSPADWESLLGLAQTRLSDWESLIGLIASRVVDWEAQSISTVSKSATTDYEARQGITRALVSDWESVFALAQASAGDWESLVSAASSRAVGIESLAGIARARAADWEAMLGLAAQRTSAFESLVSLALARLADWEALAGILAPRQADWEAQGFLSVSQSRSADFEALAGVAGARTGDFEARGTVLATLAADWEAIASLSGPAQKADFEALAGQLRAGVAALEARGTVIRSLAVDFESRTTLGAVATGDIEAGAGVGAAAAALWESKAQVAAIRAATLEALAAIAAVGSHGWESYWPLGYVPPAGLPVTEYTAFLTRLLEITTELTRVLEVESTIGEN